MSDGVLCDGRPFAVLRRGGHVMTELFPRDDADELRHLRQEQRAIIRELSKWFRRPYESEPLSAYVNCAIGAARRA